MFSFTTVTGSWGAGWDLALVAHQIRLQQLVRESCAFTYTVSISAIITDTRGNTNGTYLFLLLKFDNILKVII